MTIYQRPRFFNLPLGIGPNDRGPLVIRANMFLPVPGIEPTSSLFLGESVTHKAPLACGSVSGHMKELCIIDTNLKVTTLDEMVVSWSGNQFTETPMEISESSYRLSGHKFILSIFRTQIDENLKYQKQRINLKKLKLVV